MTRFFVKSPYFPLLCFLPKHLKMIFTKFLSLVTPRQSFCFAVLLSKTTVSYDRLPLLFRKKRVRARLSRLRRPFGCKRPHNAFGSLPPCCETAHFVHLKTLDSTMLFVKFCKNTRATVYSSINLQFL